MLKAKKIFDITVGVLKRIYDPYLKAVWSKKKLDSIRWRESNRYNYDIDNDDIIIDIGEYKGEFAERLLAQYTPQRIHIFEPVSDFYSHIENKFKNSDNVVVHRYGISNKNTTKSISISGEASTTFSNKGSQDIKLRDISDVIGELDIEEVKLLKINAEGAEYGIMERLIKTGLIQSIKNVQIQFHENENIKNYAKKRKKIRRQLSNTHVSTYEYYFIWENWTLKDKYCSDSSTIG